MISFYFSFILISIFHELGHYIALKLFRVPIIKIIIGNFFHFGTKKIKISPIVLNGSVEFFMEQYEKLALIPRLIIIGAGPMMNFLLFFLLPKHLAALRLISLSIGIFNLLPIPYLNTDGGNIIKELFIEWKKKRLLPKSEENAAQR